jgi:hypothetical protein
MINKSSKQGSSEMVGKSSVSEGETIHMDWITTMVVNIVAETKPPLGGGSNFLAKREY